MAGYFELDEVALGYETGWDGMVGRDLNRRLDTLAWRGRTSVGRRTGLTQSRIQVQDRVTVSDGIEGSVSANTSYARFHHDPTKPHLIVPRRAKALRFTIAARVVYASRVRHPGTRGNPFLARYLREAVQ